MQKFSPKVSVLLPVHNAGRYLEAAVSSLLTQTVNDLEVILIDDHSTDSAISSLPGDDRRLNRVPATGRGLVDALNQALAMARGEYIARMDGDDICMPQRLERQLAHAGLHAPDTLIGARVAMFTDNGPCADGYQDYEHWINALTTPDAINDALFIESPLPHPTLLCRRDTLNSLNGYRDQGWPEDYDLWLRAWHAGFSIAKPDEVLLQWRDHPHRLSRNDAHYSSEQFIKLKAHFLAKMLHAPVIIWGAGRGGKRLSDALAHEGVATQAFIDVSKKRIGGQARGRLVLAPEEIREYSNTILVAVGTRGVRPQIRQFLDKQQRREGKDYWFTA